MPSVHRIERARQHQLRSRGRQLDLAVRLSRHAIRLSRQQPVDGIPQSDRPFRIVFIRFEKAAWGRCGNPARAGEPQDDRARNDILLGGAVTPTFGHHSRAVVGAR